MNRELARVAAAQEKSKDDSGLAVSTFESQAAPACPPPSSPIQIDDESPETPVEIVEVPTGTNTKRKRGKGKEKAPEPRKSRSRSKSRNDSPQSSKFDRQKKLEARLAADKANEPENRKKLEAQKEVWQRTREERSP